MNALAPLGMVSGLPSDDPVQSRLVPSVDDRTAVVGTGDDLTGDARTIDDLSVDDRAKDYFVVRDGMKFAGMHLLVDIWTATDLDDPSHIDRTLCDAARAAGATILHRHFHHFTPNGGVSGVVVLAESHISIHTWPERQFAAVDVFMCGNCDPYRSVPMLRRAFQAKRVDVSERRRGRVAG